MLYHIIKPVIRLALLLFCRRKVYMNRRDYLQCRGPLLLAVNHPNSFLDAIMVGVFFRQPVHFLARGDAFRKSWALKILSSLKCIPVYRLREGKEYLHLNEDSFERCRAVFRKGGIVLIFSEGLCINEWNIRPLRKGTARLAFSSWKDPAIGSALRVLPVGVNYNSFRRFGKKVYVRFGEMFGEAEAATGAGTGADYLRFNQLLGTQLETLCFNHVPNTQPLNGIFSFLQNNMPGERYAELKAISRNLQSEAAEYTAVFGSIYNRYHCALTRREAQHSFRLALLTAVPAFLGFLFSGWFYKLTVSITDRKNRELGHYDSIVFTALALFYPIYALLLAILAGVWSGNGWLALAVFSGMPVTAWFLTVFWPNWQRFWNYNRLKPEQRISLQRFTQKHYKK